MRRSIQQPSPAALATSWLERRMESVIATAPKRRHGADHVG
jgi:hypothetical protein